MNQKAQAGLEYLVTYGWALVLIAAALGVLVFILSSPASDVTFSSSDPTKILMKAGTVTGTDTEIKMQNITGGRIEITSVSMPSGYSPPDCSLNDTTDTSLITSSNPVQVMAGGEIFIECANISEPSGTISIDYTDYSSLQRNVDITASGTAAAATECTNGQTQDCPLQAGVCSGAQQTCTSETWPGCDATTYQNHNANYEETEATCDDTLDNDCDGDPDCDDTDCAADPACAGGLVAWYKFNGDATDSSGNGNHGAFIDNAYSDGAVLILDGAGDYASISDADSLDVTNYFTLSAWFNSFNTIDASNEYVALLDKEDAYGIWWEGDDGKIKLGTFGGNVKSTRSTWNANEWYHVVGVHDGSTTYIYVNGVEDNSGTNADDVTVETSEMWIGHYEYNDTYFRGLIDEAKIYNRALNATEICSVCKEHIPAGGACNC